MAFWSKNTLEPLRKFRFQVRFTNFGQEDVLWYAKTVTQPSPDVSMSEHQLINHKIKYPGIVTWNDIDIAIIDPIGQGFKLFQELEKNGYKYLLSEEGDGIKKNQFFEKDILIEKLSASGEILETWKLINPFIKSIKYGDLDYSSDELLEITITVAYDSATLT